MKKIIVISAVWCPSCLILKKQLKNLKNEFDNVEIEIFDYDLDEDEIRKYDIGETLPVVMDANNLEKRLIGEKKYEDVISFIGECLEV